MLKRAIFVLSLAVFPLLTSANNLTLNERVTPVGVNDKGELIYDNNQFSYQGWNSAKLVGKVRIIQHIAGRTSAKELNAPLVDAIKLANLPRDRYQTTTIVNTDDAIIGTGPFVRSSIEENKREFPWSQFIVDSNGFVAKAWGLKAKSSAIIVLDKEGKIVSMKEGALTAAEVQQTISSLHKLLAD